MSTGREPNWVKLNTTEIGKRSRQQIDGVEINVIMSPYDVPDAVRGRFDISSKRFLIEFKYLDDEKAVDQHGDQFVSFRVGKNSGRLLTVVIDVNSIGAKEVGLRMHVPKAKVSEVLAKLRDAMGGLTRMVDQRSSLQKNYELAEEVVEDRSAEVFRELVEA